MLGSIISHSLSQMAGHVKGRGGLAAGIPGGPGDPGGPGGPADPAGPS